MNPKRKIKVFISAILCVCVLSSCGAVSWFTEPASHSETFSDTNTSSSTSSIDAQEHESSKASSTESLTKQEKDNYFDKYIAPYYICGLLYTTWRSSSDIDPNQLLKFYEYNAYFDILPQMLAEDPQKYADSDTIAIDAADVEFYIMYYFSVDVQHLRKSNAYDAKTNSYQFSKCTGIGGGSGVDITHIKQEADTMTFYCEDMNNNELTVTVQIINEDQFKYVSGTGVDY